MKQSCAGKILRINFTNGILYKKYITIFLHNFHVKENFNMEHYQKAAVLLNEFESQILASMLEENKIPHNIESYYDLAYDGLFQISSGWGFVETSEEYVEEVRTMLENIRKSNPDPDIENIENQENVEESSEKDD